MKPLVEKKRCAWVSDNPLYIDYHDKEWGKPIKNSRLLFEFLCLEGMQAGLSWITILKKRARYRQLFADFDAKRIAQFSDNQLQKLLTDPGIIRNRLKVNAIRKNARACLAIEEQGDFVEYLWQFVDGQTQVNRWQRHEEIPTQTARSEAMSKQLKRDGFTFVGPTICYAFMQAVGMVDDHLVQCWCKDGVN